MPEFFDVYDCNRRKTGRIIQRGQPLGPDDYRLVVQVWIRNQKGQWLLSQRSQNKSYPLKWEPTGGCVVAGEDSLTAALRETREEVGIALSPSQGVLLRSLRRDKPSWENPGFLDIWVFPYEGDPDAITLQQEETCAAIWASMETILQMDAAGALVPISYLPIIQKLTEQRLPHPEGSIDDNKDQKL